ncbi:MAG: DNA polymerase III subunit alpha [Flavobacteriales bacterium]
MYLIFDTETTGLPDNYKAPMEDTDNWPRLVQLAWQTHDENGKLIAARNYIVRPEGFTIPFNSEKIHGISTERAEREGYELSEVLRIFDEDLRACQYVIGHNIDFDINIVGAEYIRKELEHGLLELEKIDTKDEATDFCKIPGGKGGKFKWPKLSELHQVLFGEPFEEAHNAAADVEATARCFFALLTKQVLSISGEKVDPGIVDELASYTRSIVEPTKEEGSEGEDGKGPERFYYEPGQEAGGESEDPFTHLHLHSQFSLLNSTIQLQKLVDNVREKKMDAVAVTDNGNMFGIFNFVRTALDAGIKPIVGTELYMVEDRSKQKFAQGEKDIKHQQVFLAKNKNGYHNLAKLNSRGFTEGFYRIHPRVDKELILEHKEDLIAISGGLRGEIPDLILNKGEHQAEEAFKWWVDQFGEDFYVELQRHGLEEERRVNEVLYRFADKYDVKVIASNNVHYLEKADNEAHDILLCVRAGEKSSTPIGEGRGYRPGFPNSEYYLKDVREMNGLFSDMPEAIENTQEVVKKIESFRLEKEVVLPSFDLPEGFSDQNEYLRHLTYQGAEDRYGEVTEGIQERLDFELATIANTDYPGYFLIVADFTSEARRRGVSVGPGRGSAAGSVVAYCLGITNVDPIGYGLLFERFLNPDRVSLPDIDIDFDDEGRAEVLQYVIEKYGRDQVAQIITYGTMAGRSAIKDVGRVMDLPLADTEKVASLVPFGGSLNKVMDLGEEELKEKLRSEEVEGVQELQRLAQGNELTAQVIQQARVIEGSLRNTGVHACGVIITPDPINEHVPVCTSKDSELLLTQFDNHVVEDAGMLKMDFLGLRTLTIINTATRLVKERHGVSIDPEKIPLDDPNTFDLFQRGNTAGIFQFESEGMQKSLRALKPNRFEDLIAMNALYRPGPMENIPEFIKRKHGEEEIQYQVPEMQEYLEETYGITVYQEQVMLLAQKLAAFSKGQADSLRKAMGKKIKAKMDELKPKFFEGCQANGYDEATAQEIWDNWESFASYAFNKSHSTCYSFVAFQTGFLKANYPAEYMAAVLTHNMHDIKKVSFFMEAAKRMDIPVLGPDVNESKFGFAVNEEGAVRFGLGALKGVGDAAVKSIVDEREANGPFGSVFDLLRRVDLKSVNKKAFESLALAGAFDAVGPLDRAQFFYKEGNEEQPFLDKLFRYGNSYQESKKAPQGTLFGDGDDSFEMPEPEAPQVEEWGTMRKLSQEKEIVGVYISGHPLDDHRAVIDNFCNADLSDLEGIPDEHKGKEYRVAGIVTNVAHKTSKKGTPFGILTMEDYKDSYEFFLFSDTYMNSKPFMEEGTPLLVYGKPFPNKRNDNNALELKVDRISLLTEALERSAKELLLELPIDEISEELMDILHRTFEENSEEGSCQVKFRVKDPVENLKVDMPSKKMKVSVTTRLIEELDRIEQVSYSLS